MNDVAGVPTRTQTTFLHLPAELRNRIYELSGCLTVVQCENCRKHCTLDIMEMGFKRSCSGNPRIQWPLKYPRHFTCRFVVSESVDLSRYTRDKIVQHEYIDSRTCELAIPQPHSYPIPEQPALTRVCRQLRTETLPIFYGRNKFDFTPKVTTVDGVGRLAKADLAWLAAIGPANSSLIRSVEVRWLGWCRRALLGDFKANLRAMGVRVDVEGGVRVEVSCWYVSWRNCYVLRKHYVDDDDDDDDEGGADECACE